MADVWAEDDSAALRAAAITDATDCVVRGSFDVLAGGVAAGFGFAAELAFGFSSGGFAFAPVDVAGLPPNSFLAAAPMPKRLISDRLSGGCFPTIKTILAV